MKKITLLLSLFAMFGINAGLFNDWGWFGCEKNEEHPKKEHRRGDVNADNAGKFNNDAQGRRDHYKCHDHEKKNCKEKKCKKQKGNKKDESRGMGNKKNADRDNDAAEGRRDRYNNGKHKNKKDKKN